MRNTRRSALHIPSMHGLQHPGHATTSPVGRQISAVWGRESGKPILFNHLDEIAEHGEEQRAGRDLVLDQSTGYPCNNRRRGIEIVLLFLRLSAGQKHITFLPGCISLLIP
jgi:hypothetical protein